MLPRRLGVSNIAATRFAVHLLLALSKGSTGFLVCFGGAALQHLHPLAKKQFLPLQSVHGAAAMLVARHT